MTFANFIPGALPLNVAERVAAAAGPRSWSSWSMLAAMSSCWVLQHVLQPRSVQVLIVNSRVAQLPRGGSAEPGAAMTCWHSQRRGLLSRRALQGIDLIRRQVVSFLFHQRAWRYVFVEPDPILLETLGVSSPQCLDICAFLESFSEVLTSKPQQAEKVEPIALGVVRQVSQFVSDDRPPGFLGGRKKVGPLIHPNHITHPAPEDELREAESRLKIIGVAGELFDANVLFGEFRERRRPDVADQPLRPFRSAWLTSRNGNTGEEDSHEDC